MSNGQRIKREYQKLGQMRQNGRKSNMLHRCSSNIPGVRFQLRMRAATKGMEMKPRHAAFHNQLLDAVAKADLQAHSVMEQATAIQDPALVTQLALFNAALKAIVEGAPSRDQS